jgi:4-amino-4-deoxy-L-arabinose transferase-like glycosyltransferase
MFFVLLALFSTMSFVLGYGILCNLPRSAQQALVTHDTTWALCFAVSFPVLGFIHFAAFRVARPTAFFNLLFLSMLLTLLYVRAWRSRRFLPVPRTPEAAAFGCFLGLLLVIQMLTPSYGIGFTADWALYYPNIDAFLGKTPLPAVESEVARELLFKRTPLLSLCGSFFLSLTGPSYATFQVICLLQNAMVFWGIYLVGKQLFSHRAAILALGVLPLAPSAVRGLIAPEPKSAASFFLLLGACYYLQARKRPGDANVQAGGAAAGVCMVVALLYHPSMLFYAVWLYVDQIHLFDRRRPLLPALWWSTLAVAAGLLGPWFGFLVDSEGWEAAVRPTKTLSSGVTGIGDFFYTRLTMIVASVVAPSSLLDKIKRTHRFWGDLFDLGFVAHTRAWGDYLVRLYEESMVAATTLSSSLLLLALGWNTRPREVGPVARRLLYLWLGLGALASVVSIVGMVDNQGQARNVMTPVVLVMIVYIGHILASLRSTWVVTFFVLAAAEMTYTRFLIFVLGRERMSATPTVHSLSGAGTVEGLVVTGALAGLIGLAYVLALRRAWTTAPAPA